MAQLAATPLLLWTGACVFMTDSCVAAGSPVATPGGWVPVEALRPGDPIFAVDVASGGLVATVVTAVRSSHRECIALVGAHGRRLCVTPDHPIYAPEHAGFVAAGRLALGQTNRVLMFAAIEAEARAGVVELVDRHIDAGVHPVHDITVAGAHPTFVAEGFVVHNKSYDPSSSSTSLPVTSEPPTTGGSEDIPTTGSTGSTGEVTTGTTTTGSSGEGTTTSTGATDSSSSSGSDTGDTGAPQFACGNLSCSLADEYCQVFHPGVEGEIIFTCQPIPAACLPEPDCMCLAAQAIEGECTGTSESGLRVDVLGV